MLCEVLKSEDKYITVKIPKEYMTEFDKSIKNSYDKVLNSESLLDEFEKISQNVSIVDSDVDVVRLEKEINSDIF
jgi:hypothetical protein